MSGLEFRNVVKHYASPSGEVVRAVDGVTLTVGEGEFVAVYGPSGSGKTTLLMIAAGMQPVDSGEVVFEGRDLSKMGQDDAATFRLRDLGFIFQAFHLIGGASAVDNAAVKLIGGGSAPKDARERAREWLDRIGLKDRAEHTPAQLSTGECQRVAIARALVNEPKLVLADEPTGNLDTERIRQVLGLLQNLSHERGLPVLLVTHDELALEFVDRAHTLRDGRLSEPIDAQGVNATVARR
jgi:putative ABC transport system ATP-binding protein